MNKVGIIGFGYWGKIIYSVLSKIMDLDLIEIYSSKEHPNIATTKNLNSIFESVNINYLFIATPTITHYSLVSVALMNGKNVFCEKPLSMDLKEVETLFQIAFEKKLKLFVDYTYLYSPSLKRILTDIKDDKILDIDISMEQMGPSYDESVVWTLGTHVFSILDEIIDLTTIKIDKLNFENDELNLHRRVVTTGKAKQANFKVNVSVINEKRRTIIITSEKKKYSYDLLGNPTVKIYDLKEQLLESYGNQFGEKSNLINSINAFLKNDLTFINYHKTLRITTAINSILNLIEKS